MNKLQDYETSFDAWEKWRDIWVISPQSQKYLWLYFFSLYKPIEEKMRSNFLSLSLLISVSLLLHHFHLLQAFLCWKSATPIFFLLLRCVFHVCLDNCWWELFKSWEMFYCHEIMFNWDGISRIWSCLLVNMKELRSAKNRTHRVCMMSELFRFDTDVFAFFWYFS